MKIGFFGTPEISRVCLEGLYKFFEIAFVFTCEDKPQGRCLHVCKTPVKEFAESKNIPVLQFSSLKDETIVDTLKSFNADIFVVMAFGKIIPRCIYEIPRLKTINLHPSLLPKYRGAAPIQFALINGETTSGITVQLIDDKLDSGDIVLQKNFEIEINDTVDKIYSRIMDDACVLLKDAILALDSSTANLCKQNNDAATYCTKISREMARANFSQTSLKLHNLVRALNPKPVVWTTFKNKNLKIWETKIANLDTFPEIEAGELFKIGKKNLYVKTIDGALEILQLQPENKKVMSALEFINGNRLQVGDKLI